GKRIARCHGLFGFNINGELVKVGALFNTSCINLESYHHHRRVNRVDRNTANLGVRALVLCSGDIATATFNGKFHIEFTILIEGSNMQIGVVHLDTCRWGDVCCRDYTGALLTQVRYNWFIMLRCYRQLLDIQDDLSDVFFYTLDGSELVKDLVNTNRGDSGTWDR